MNFHSPALMPRQRHCHAGVTFPSGNYLNRSAPPQGSVYNPNSGFANIVTNGNVSLTPFNKSVGDALSAMTTRQNINKAAFSLSDMATGGLLLTRQSKEFVAMLRYRPTLLGICRFVPVASPSQQIDRIGFTGRLLHKGTENTAVTEPNQTKPTTSKVSIATQLFKGEVEVSYEAGQDNIMGGNTVRGNPFESYILSLIAGQVALDIEEFSLLSDTASGDTDLTQFNGLLKLAQAANSYNHAGANISKTPFKSTMLALPIAYRQNVSELLWLVSPNAEVEWMDEQADRVTLNGDQVLFGDKLVKSAYGIGMLSSGSMPAGAGVAKILLTHPKNIIIAIWRSIHIDWGYDYRKSSYVIVPSIRIDAKFEQVEGSAVGYGINLA